MARTFSSKALSSKTFFDSVPIKVLPFGWPLPSQPSTRRVTRRAKTLDKVSRIVLPYNNVHTVVLSSIICRDAASSRFPVFYRSRRSFLSRQGSWPHNKTRDSTRVSEPTGSGGTFSGGGNSLFLQPRETVDRRPTAIRPYYCIHYSSTYVVRNSRVPQIRLIWFGAMTRYRTDETRDV